MAIEFQSLDAIMKGVQKEFGKDIVIDTEKVSNVPRVPISSPILGYVFGGGGCPEGRIIELYGMESSGKSLIATSIGADYQKQKKVVVYIDMEHTFSPSFANKLGLSTNELFVLLQPSSAEEALTLVERFAKAPEVGLIIIDSVAAMTPQAEIDGEMTDQQMGLQARVIGKGLRKVTSILNKTNTTLILINQIRLKVGFVMGNPETTPGGMSIRFMSSIRVDVRKVEYIKSKGSDEPIGILTRIKAVKNKTCPPFRKGEIEIYFDRGIDTFKEYVDFGVTLKVLEKSGSWYSFEGERIGQGKDNTSEWLKENPKKFAILKEKVDKELLSMNTVLDLTDPTKPDAGNIEE